MKNQRIYPLKVVSKLCTCRFHPCSHLGIGDVAMLSRKSAAQRELVRKHFNFALFVEHLISCPTDPKVKIECIQIAEKRGADVSQTDPVSGRNALHFAYMYVYVLRTYLIVNYMVRKMPNLLDMYDHNGLPPVSSGFDHNPSLLSGETRLRISIKRKSEKLFQFLFFNVIPQKWNFHLLSCIDEFNLLQMNREKRDYLLNNACDEKGNTILHIAAKTNRYRLITVILGLNINLQYKRNLKGKLPVEYCKIFDTFSLFQTNQWHKKFYFPSSRFIFADRAFLNLMKRYPKLVELVNDNSMKPVVVPQLKLIGEDILMLTDEAILLISKRARDLQGNTLWHVYTEIFSSKFIFVDLMDTVFKKFDKNLVNHRNNHGNTPLHLAGRDFVKQLLIQHGAHEDCLNFNRKVAKNIVLNLQCIAARQIPINSFRIIPKHLQDIVRLHDPFMLLYKV